MSFKKHIFFKVSYSRKLHLFLAIIFSYIFSFSQELKIPENIKNQILKDIEFGNEFKEKSDYNQSAYYFNTAASSYWMHGSLDQANKYFLLALEMQTKLGNTNGVFVINTNLGLINTELGLLANALENFKKASEQAEKLGRKHDITSSNLNKANILFELERFNETIEVLDNAVKDAQELGDARLLRNAYSLFTKVYDRLGKIEESARYFELFAAISRSIQQQEMARREDEAKKMVSQATTRVREVEAEREATERELIQRDLELLQKQRFLEQAEQESRERLMQIDLLNKQRELQEATIRHQDQMRKVYIAIIVIIWLFSGYIFYSYYEKRKANKLLEQKNAEILRQNVEIRAQSEQLRELNQLKDKLFSIISHDLRSPLGSLITLLNLTQQGYFTEEGFREVVDELSKNVGYTSELLENLLKWAQSQMRGLNIVQSKFNLYEVANSKFELYAEQSSKKGIELVNNIDQEVDVYADSNMIELVFRNLIANAIKFTNKGGRVIAETTIFDNEVLVIITDNGVGISAENIERLFGKEIFTTNGTYNEKGTGLGLILCRDFINLNGGKIWAESSEGKGSVFFFTMPLAQKIYKKESDFEEVFRN